MPNNEPYLHDFRKQGNKAGPIFKFRVYTVRSTEIFEITGYRVDKGHLILYRSELEGDNVVRAYPVAVFVPSGWLGYANDSDGTDKELISMGFTQPPKA